MAGVTLVDVPAMAVGTLVHRNLLRRLVGMHLVAALAHLGGSRRLLGLLGQLGVCRRVPYDARRAARSSSSSRRSTRHIFMRA